MKIIGIFILLFGLFVFLIGTVGAVLNFGFPPEDLACKIADKHFKQAEDAVKRYELAKGTDDEIAAEIEAERALKTASEWQDSCGRAKENYRFYGTIFAIVAVFGCFIILIGGVATFIGFRRKKKLA